MQFIPVDLARSTAPTATATASRTRSTSTTPRPPPPHYLCAAGGDLSTTAGQARAVFAYNHSDEYVASVLSLAATYAGTPAPSVPTPDVGDGPSLPPADPAGPPALERPVIDPPELAAAEPPVVFAPTVAGAAGERRPVTDVQGGATLTPSPVLTPTPTPGT